MPCSSILLWIAIGLLVVCDAISPISVKGTKLYDQRGEQFFVRGVGYQSNTGDDPLVDNDQCQIDAGLMKTLGINAIRVYAVDGAQNHDACMQTFASQGIYVWLELNTVAFFVNRIYPNWTMAIYNNWTATVDAFAEYDNLLTFSIGSEVINNADTVAAAPYLKATVRDIKAFRDARQYRKIPIAYSSADDRTYWAATADYLSCGPADTTIDIYGLDLYSWCGNSSVYEAGYNTLYEQFEASDIPVIFSETGCNAESRDFGDVATMLGTVFPAVFSGAIVYEWAQDVNNYGIVSYTADDNKGWPTTLSDYNALKTVLANASPVGTSMSAYTPSNVPPVCPTSNTDWPLNGNITLPTIAGLNITTVTSVGTALKTSTIGIASATSTPTGTIHQDKPGSISTAAVAGISVGITAAVVATVVIGAIFLTRRRSAKRQIDKIATTDDANASHEKNDIYDVGKSELPAVSSARMVPKSELEASTSQYVFSPVSSVSIDNKLRSFPKELSEPHLPKYPAEMEGSSPTIPELGTSRSIDKSTSISG